MALPAAGWPEQEQVGPGAESSIACGGGRDLSLGDGRDLPEVEGVQGPVRRQASPDKMALDSLPHHTNLPARI